MSDGLAERDVWLTLVKVTEHSNVLLDLGEKKITDKPF